MTYQPGFLTPISIFILSSITAQIQAAETLKSTIDLSDVDEIIVHDKRTEGGLNITTEGGALGNKSILDTPFSLTVVDSEDIAKRQATTVAQIFANDPSVFSFATAATTNWWGVQIRGLGVRNYYIDGVPVQLNWGGDFPLESIERVEALKGLTGFMYGLGSPGGVIHYRTKRPTTETMLTTEVGYRTNSVFFGRVDAGGTLDEDEKFGYRLNLSAEEGTAYNEAGVNRYVGSLALEYAISPDIKWYATATYEDSKLEQEPFQIYWDSYTDTETPNPDFNYDDVNIDNSYYESDTLAVATGLEWTFADDWTADFTYGYSRKNHRSNKMFVNILNEEGDYDGAAYNFPGRNSAHYARVMTQGSFNTGTLQHDIVFGGDYQGTKDVYGEFYWSNDFAGNIYETQNFLVTRDINFDLTGTPRKRQQYGAFMSDTIHFGQKWQAIVGARYTHYKLVGDDYATSAVTPTFALIYKPADHVSLYASYVESLEGGTRVGATYANFGDVLSATISKQYEVGAKYQNEHLSFTAAGFRVERANRIDKIVDGLRYLTQDGLTVYQGIELIGNLRISEAFSIGGGLVYLHPEISQVSEDNLAILGNIPAEASKWQIVGNATYQIPQIEGLSLHGNVRYFGKAPTTNANALFIKDRTLVNIGMGYEMDIAGRRVDVAANINNLFNVKYWGLSNFGEATNGSISLKVHW